MTVTVSIDKENALVDEVIQISVKGLRNNQAITVRAEVTEKGQVFAGSGCFVADRRGTVDIAKQPSLNGTYTGVSSMGLFWSMKSIPGMPEGMRLLKSNASSPLMTDIIVFPGHLRFEETFADGLNYLCSRRIRRWYMAKGVHKRKIRSGRIRGTMFLPPGRGPFPGVIDMFGVVGSCMEFRAALLASRGFAAVALPYFLFDDLPQNLHDLELEYFIEAVDWLSSHPAVDGSNIGVIGVSKGGEFALHLGFFCNKVKSVISINGGPFFTGEPALYKGKSLVVATQHEEDVIETKEGKVFEHATTCEVKDYIPIWSKDVHVLLICGLDDLCYSPQFLINLYECYPAERKHLCKLLTYEGAGHLIEPPFSPLSRTTLVRDKGISGRKGDYKVLWGGETEAHARAQKDSWKQILNHFRKTLQTRPSDQIESIPCKL